MQLQCDDWVCDYQEIKGLNFFNIDKEKAIISDGLSSVSPLFKERCCYNAMIEYVTIRK
jgi:hypothetical protein